MIGSRPTPVRVPVTGDMATDCEVLVFAYPDGSAALILGDATLPDSACQLVTVRVSRELLADVESGEPRFFWSSASDAFLLGHGEDGLELIFKLRDWPTGMWATWWLDPLEWARAMAEVRPCRS